MSRNSTATILQNGRSPKRNFTNHMNLLLKPQEVLEIDRFPAPPAPPLFQRFSRLIIYEEGEFERVRRSLEPKRLQRKVRAPQGRVPDEGLRPSPGGVTLGKCHRNHTADRCGPHPSAARGKGEIVGQEPTPDSGATRGEANPTQSKAKKGALEAGPADVPG